MLMHSPVGGLKRLKRVIYTWNHDVATLSSLVVHAMSALSANNGLGPIVRFGNSARRCWKGGEAEALIAARNVVHLVAFSFIGWWLCVGRGVNDFVIFSP
jgi:hypothetical protein